MTKLRISVVQYLNTAPLVYGFTHGPLKGKYDISFTIPSQCADDLRNDRADVAIIPAIEFQRIENLVVLPGLAIAAKRRVRSLLIVSSKPIGEVENIALDRSSRSTQALTRILCAERWHIAPRFFEASLSVGNMLENADAALLIGDPALRLAIAVANYATLGSEGELLCNAEKAGINGTGTLYIYDVVQEWRRWSGLPAVLAIWAARPEVITPEIVADFAASKSYGVANIAEISAAAAEEEGWPAGELLTYLRENIDFTLDAENLAGLELYYCLAAKLGLIPQAKSIEWASERADAVHIAKSF
ncbi:MAG: menaquinone biosynthesis protein [Acidobacteriota bacterium]|nr:menaquinone biosynthesis protein [Acidobacteriota bacterium]